MKSYLAALLILCLCPFAFAQDDAGSFLRFESEYESAVATGNTDGLAPLIASDFTGVGVSNERIQGVSGLKQYWATIRGVIGHGGTIKTKVTFEASDITGDIAISRGKSDTAVTTKAGKVINYESQWTAVSKKQDGVWKLSRLHESIDPFNNEVDVALSRYKAMKYGSISGVLALIIGAVSACVVMRNFVGTDRTRMLPPRKA